MTLNITALWDALGWAILHSLWQGAVIGFLVWVVRALATDHRAWLRYLAGMGGLVATFAAFLTTFVILMFNRAQDWTPIAFTGDTESGAASELSLSISVLPLQLAQTELNSAGLTMGGVAELIVPWLGILWAVGFAFLSLQAYRAFATTRWLATQGLDTPNADWTARFSGLIQRSRTHARVRLFISEHVNGPMTLGALRPIVLVPVGFLTALPPAQVDAILLHELAHIRRHDFLFGLIQTAIRTALYFNPAVIMISRQIDEDREKACDDIAVAISGNPGDLVRGLAALRLGHQVPAMAMAADGGPLLTRLNRLMGRPASRQTSSRLSAAAVSALLLGTAACSTVSMANPPEAPVVPEATLQDTIVRAAPTDTPRAYVISSADMPAMPPMPAMPAVPATPPLPAVPTPVFGDYDSEEAFEAAMEAWGERMEIWGKEVERRFEGDWEDKMEAWGEEMEVWGESFEALAADFEGNEFAALAALGNLESLGGLAALAELGEGVYAIDPSDHNAKAEDIRSFVMRKVEAERRQAQASERQAAMVDRQVNAKERAKAQKERAKAQVERQVAQAEREIAHQKRMVEHQQRQFEHQVRQAEYQQRVVDAATARRDSRTGAHTNQKITVTSDEPGSTVVINGRTLDVDAFRAKMMAALIEDGFITARNKSVTIELCDEDLEVNGRSGTEAQAKRYAKMFKSAGFDENDSIVLKFKPDLMSVALSGHGQKNVKKISVGTFDHTPSK